MFKNRLTTTVMGKKKMKTLGKVDPDLAPIKTGRTEDLFRTFQNKHYMEFDGTDSYLEGTKNHFAMGEDDFTMAFWVYIKGTAFATHELASKYVDNNNHWRLYTIDFLGTKIITFTSKIGGSTETQRVYNGTDFVNDDWNHIVFTADRDGNLTFYTNGSQAGANILSGSATTEDLDVNAPLHLSLIHI